MKKKNCRTCSLGESYKCFQGYLLWRCNYPVPQLLSARRDDVWDIKLDEIGNCEGYKNEKES